MSRHFFITSSGTGIGKTLVAASLTHQLRAAGNSVSTIKPVISGFSESDLASDTHELLSALQLPHTVENINTLSPWRFAAPLAPSIAAQQAGQMLSMEVLLSFCRLPRTGDITLLEGAGGVMAPLNDTHTTLDWIEALNWPIILVAGSYLGAISHALTAAEALKNRNVPIHAIIVSESEHPAMDISQTAGEIKKFAPDARYVVPLPRVAGGKNLWQHTADLTWILS